MMRDENTPLDGPEQEVHADGDEAASWWEETLVTRREAGQVGASMAMLLGVSGLSVGLEACCGSGGSSSSSTDDVKELDSLAAQKKHGWDVGDSGKKVALGNTTEKDSLDSNAWKDYTSPDALMKVARPSEKWRPYEQPTLFQSLKQEGLAKQLKPIRTAGMKAAHDRGLAMASLIHATKSPEATMLVVDMPGPESIALAAGMAELVEPVFFFDNWPHPEGVVPSERTLAAMLYYAEEFKEKAEKRAKLDSKTPTALVLDSNRLNAYQDSSSKFDNRYLANIPDAKGLKKLGVTNVLYVTPKTGKKELDDLNEPMVELEKDSDTKVSSIALEAFQKDPSAPKEDNSTGGYYYGGGHRHHGHFYTWYPMFFFYSRPRYSSWSSSPTAPPATSKASKPSYRPAPRKTLFSGRTTGAKSGVGRTKPTGFGRVSVRQGAGGKVSRSSRSAASRSGRSGRSGSFGRSRGGGFG